MLAERELEAVFDTEWPRVSEELSPVSFTTFTALVLLQDTGGRGARENLWPYILLSGRTHVRRKYCPSVLRLCRGM